MATDPNTHATMSIDSRRILGGFAVFALVLLRLMIGWHFFGEGTRKVEFDWHERKFRPVFTADTFLAQAKGPLAPVYLAHLPADHDWRTLLSAPRENVPRTSEQSDDRTRWMKEYAARRAEATKKGAPAPVEFCPGAPFHEWGAKIAGDWRTAVHRIKSLPGMTEAQKSAADAALHARLESLAEYLAGEEQAMAEYRHELWRLANWRKSPEAGEAPFVEERIATKAAETAASAKAWVEQVEAFDDAYIGDLKGILTPEQRDGPATAAIVQEILSDPHQGRLDLVNRVVTGVTIGVGACLILGFFTRLAALVGALFLLGVIASQPFWVSDAAPTINQCVEFAGLLVLAGTGAGRWLGIDGLVGRLFGRRRHLAVQEI